MRRTFILLGVLVVLPLLALGGSYWGYMEAGRSPGELMDYLERRLLGHPKLESIALPVLDVFHRKLDAPSRIERFSQPFVIPPLPELPLADETTVPLLSVVPQAAGSDAGATAGRVLRVGPAEQITSIHDAAVLAHDGDTVEILSGTYRRDVAIWPQKNLTIRGVGGRVRLIADGYSAESKAIWVIRDGTFVVENIEFIGAKVRDRNGAGIRFEKGSLTLRNCLFYGNQNGLLATGGDSELTIENSEFGYNGAGDGLSHNLYVGPLKSLQVTGSYFHHANVGHLLKSRAAYNFIAYNRLTDEAGGRASYELEFPNGGLAFVIGNIIQQSNYAENSILLSFGAEHYTWPNNRLFVASNTLVNDVPYGGSFLRVYPGAKHVVAANNLLAGAGKFHVSATFNDANNVKVGPEVFHDALRLDYRLAAVAPGLAFQPPPALSEGVNLTPWQEYVHPRQLKLISGTPALAGALQTLAR
ncbi:MAG: right-handed parallel beta-helix repeat-containing protein [Gallionella sp.]|nr:right-handed parallel beta-helix repeat-containing protein [Gallionella sp.]MDD4946948.1 right-handed parallel beta-helix repeat-containing protein [Gallionella sp.]MDD5611626.1 right-handed parallel beta-helix repeat-containing protein [Gallionella sp.]